MKTNSRLIILSIPTYLLLCFSAPLKAKQSTIQYPHDTQNIQATDLNSYSYVSPFAPYELNYLLPLSTNTSAMDYDEILPHTKNLDYEVKFQISAQTALLSHLLTMPLSLNMFYTQVSYWQFYAPSAYFRETNYNPGLFLHFQPVTKPLPMKMYSIDLGAMHQSNGMGSINERSWNRIYLNFTFHLTNSWALSVRPWYRIHALEDQDYNPNITKYLGDGDLRISYAHNNFRVYLLLRNEIESGFSRGAEEIDFAFPFFHHIHGFVQAFSGYGQSLISYNHPTNSVGVGFSLLGQHTPNT